MDGKSKAGATRPGRDHPARPPWLGRVLDVLLTTDPAQRTRLAQIALALGLMAASVVVMMYVVWLGGASAAPVVAWSVLAFGGMVAFFALVRSGWSRRHADPALTAPQMVYAIACGAIAYALAGPARGATLPVAVITLMFGMFQLPPRQVALIGVYALAAYGVAMLWGVLVQPERYDARIEAAHFLVLAAMVPAGAVLAARLSRLRQRLRRQKSDLVQALARIELLATHDELTGLVNRRQAAELLERELVRSARSAHPLSVALLDLDHFKAVNDSHGHAAGDAVLRAFAADAPTGLRGPDTLARWGGEEFLLLLPDTPATAATRVVERLRARAQALEIDAAGARIRITVSAGVTQHIAGETGAALLERADHALYRAKDGGRNRVVAG